MIRCLFTVVSLLSVGWGQASTPPPMLAKADGEIRHTSLVSPALVRPADAVSARPLPDIPPLPAGKTTLIGGTIRSVDHVRDRIVLQVFAGKAISVLFDERTRLFRDGKAASLGDLKKGDRAYLDTTLDGTAIFVRNIRIAAVVSSGQGSGQIVTFDKGTGELTLRDTLSPEPVTMRLDAGASILQGDHTVTRAELQVGSLVVVTFDPAGKTPTVRQVSILASPGTAFVFVGRIEHLDFRTGLLVLVDPRDNKNYDLYFDSGTDGVTRDLKQGMNVTARATFDGTR